MRRPAVIILVAAATLATGLSLTGPAQSAPSATIQSAPVLIPVQAEAAPETTEDTNRDKIQRGWDSLLEGLTEEMAPGLKALQDWADAAGPALESFLEEMGPALVEMMDQVRDWSNYEAPEILPNGDIIIRRKPEAGPLNPETPPAEADGTTGGPIDI